MDWVVFGFYICCVWRRKKKGIKNYFNPAPKIMKWLSSRSTGMSSTGRKATRNCLKYSKLEATCHVRIPSSSQQGHLFQEKAENGKYMQTFSDWVWSSQQKLWVEGGGRCCGTQKHHTKGFERGGSYKKGIICDNKRTFRRRKNNFSEPSGHHR